MLLEGQPIDSFFIAQRNRMISALIALKNHLDTRREMFKGSSSSEEIGIASMVGIGLILMLAILYSYGAARLSYFYNVNTGNAGYAMMWSILAFLLSDVYYPYYSFFLNPQSARGGNNIKLN
jgi:hypothetical protein